MKNFVILLLLFVSTHAIANVQKIVAIVNDDPITLRELDERAALIAFFSNVNPEDINQNKLIRQMALENLIDEQLLSERQKALGIKIDENEINKGIDNIETNNKMEKGQFANLLRENNISYSSFRTKVKNDILKFRLASEVLSNDVNISNNILEAVVLDQKIKDADVTLKIFTTKDSSKKAYDQMLSASKKIKDCNNVKESIYQNIATLNTINTKFSKLDGQTKNIVKNLKINGHSGPVKMGDEFKVIMLCAKKVDNLTEQENNYFTNFLTNKKLGLKLKKYQEDLRKKAYIKIL